MTHASGPAESVPGLALHGPALWASTIGIVAIVGVSAWAVKRFHCNRWLTWDSGIEAIVGLLQALFR